MKRVVITGMAIIVLLTSCQQLKQTTVQEASLTDFEEKLLKMVAIESFVYDLEIANQDVEEVEVSIDYYEYGDFIDTVNRQSLTVDEEQENDLFRIAFISRKAIADNIQWSVAVFTDSTTSTSQSNERKKITSQSSAWSSINSSVALEIGKKQILAHIVYSNEDGGLSTSTYAETDEDLYRLTNYDHVFILSVELK